MSEHVDPAEVLALVALTEGDPALQAARAHARDCAECAAQLAESAALLALIDGENQPVAVSPALRARIVDSPLVRPGARFDPLAVRAVPRKQRAAQLAIVLTALLSALLSWLDGQGSEGGLAALVPSVGVRCLAYESAFALVPLGVGLVLSRAGKLQLDATRFAAWTMSFALIGQLLLRSRCEVHDLSVHLFAFHFVGVLLAGLVGGGVGRFLHSADAPA